MSDTKKDRDKDKHHKSKIKLSKKIKREAKHKRKALSDETNPRVLKLKASDCWNFN